MSEQNLIDLLERAAARSSIASAPTGAMLLAARSMRRRRGVASTVVAAATVAAVVGGTVAVVSHDHRKPVPTKFATAVSGTWVVDALNDAAGRSAIRAAYPRTVELTFRQGRIDGTPGCSHIAGTYEQSGSTGQDLTIRAAEVPAEGPVPLDDCGEPPLLVSLGRVRHVAAAADVLRLTDADGLIVAELRRPGAVVASARVTCSPDGISIEPRQIQTSAEGVVIVVSSTMPEGSYLTRSSSGGGSSGGDRLPHDAERRVLDLAPGTIKLGCWDPATDIEFKTTFTVIDPAANWRGDEAVGQTGCVFKPGIYDWAGNMFQRAPTAAGAAQLVTDEIAKEPGNVDASMSVRPLPVGYVGARRQTWMVFKGQKAYATLRVSRGADDFNASADQPCE